MTSTDIYLFDYHKLVFALTNSPSCPVTGEVTDNEIKIVLGQYGIWPTSILPDVISELDSHSLRDGQGFVRWPPGRPGRPSRDKRTDGSLIDF
jgi:hypothetical protein